MVPHHIPQVVGGALSTGAKATTAAVSKSRSAMFTKKPNTRLSAPLGLDVDIVTSTALKVELGNDPGKPLVADLSDDRELSVQQSRMLCLRSYVSPVSFDVPPPKEQANVLEKISASSLKRQNNKSEEKALKDRQKALGKQAKHARKDNKKKEGRKIDHKEVKSSEKILWLLMEDLWR